VVAVPLQNGCCVSTQTLAVAIVIFIFAAFFVTAFLALLFAALLLLLTLLILLFWLRWRHQSSAFDCSKELLLAFRALQLQNSPQAMQHKQLAASCTGVRTGCAAKRWILCWGSRWMPTQVTGENRYKDTLGVEHKVHAACYILY
jgi:hypothetical protein